MDTYGNNITHEETMLAVDGQDIYFHFRRKEERAVLNSVNIAVNRGTIYSLLGPSGCGKTTLLKCIVGQHKPKAGSLKIFGRSPGSKGFFIPGRGVGYMPQDLPLYMEMGIKETLTYFGSLYGMSRKNISERISFLLELLELPNKNELIEHLSGGQQRRVSFAIALIHKPPLLVLDEPTVGVDPLLRKSVWDHMVALAVKEHITVIITTHYTEETRQAHTVGLMRNGKILIERNPEDLIRKYGAFTLEDVFLKICQKGIICDEDLETSTDEFVADRNLGVKYLLTNGAVPDEIVIAESHANTTEFVNTSGAAFDQRNNLNGNSIPLLPLPPRPAESGHEIVNATHFRKRMFCLTRKNFLLLRRNVAFLLFTLIMAAIHVSIFFLCLSSNPFDLQVAISYEEEEEELNKFGEKFLISINNRTISKKQFPNFTLAYQSLEKGESWAALHIHSDFSTCLADRILEGLDASNDTLHCSSINVILDTSNYIIANTIRSSLFQSYQTFGKDLLKSVGKNPLLAELPLRIEEYTKGSKSASFVEFLAPAFMLCTAYVLSSTMTEMAMISERKRGLLSRTVVAGATTTEVLLSFFFAYLVVMIVQLMLMMAVGFWAFSLPCNGPFFWIIVAIMLAGIHGMSYGFLISALTDSENVAALTICGSFLPVVIMCGIIWPLESVPYYLRYISYCLPLTRLIEGARGIVVRGWSITDNHVWDGYLICSSWTVGKMILSIILLKIKK